MLKILQFSHCSYSKIQILLSVMQSSSWSDSCLLPHAHILLCSHLFIYFLVLIQVTVDSNIEEVRLPILCTVKNLTLKKFQSPYSAWFHNLQIQPTKDCVILQYLLKKKSVYKWTCAVQSHFVQGSIVFQLFQQTVNLISARQQQAVTWSKILFPAQELNLSSLDENQES